MDVINTRRARPRLQFAAQSVVLLVCASCHHLDLATVAVPHPSGDADLRRFALDKPAEADALHASGDEITTGLKVRHLQLSFIG